MGRTKPASGGSTRTRAGGERVVATRRRTGGRHEAPPSVASVARSISSSVLQGRALIGLAILIAVVMGIPSVTSEAKDESPGSAVEEPPRVTSRKADEPAPLALCPIDWRQSTQHVKQLIRCAASHFGVDEEDALYIAWRESRYQPYAYNEEGEAAGIYQHLLKYWPERTVEFGAANWSVFDARANILVTMQMVRRYGWEPWSL